MSLIKLVFSSEEDYRRARDISLEMRAREGWKPKPDLEMLVSEERAEALRQELDKHGVPYTAEQG